MLTFLLLPQGFHLTAIKTPTLCLGGDRQGKAACKELANFPATQSAAAGASDGAADRKEPVKSLAAKVPPNTRASTHKGLRSTTISTTAVKISAHVQTSNSYGTTRPPLCCRLHLKKKKPRLFPCGIKKQIISSSKVTWTIQSWLTWPQYEFPWELVRLLKLVKRFMHVFKPLINYIQRTFQAYHLNLT